MILSDADVLTFLGIPAMTALAAQSRQNAEAHVKDHIGTQEIEQQTWVEFFPLEQQSILHEGDPHYVLDSSGTHAVALAYTEPHAVQLRQFLPRSVTEVRQDLQGYFGQYAGSFGPTTILTSGTDYYLLTEQSGLSWTGQLMRRAFWWPGNPGSTMVTYVAGLTAAELNGRWSVIKEACLEELADLYIRALTVQGGQRPDVQNQNLGGGAGTSFRDNHASGLCVCDSAAAKLTPFVSYAEMAL